MTIKDLKEIMKELPDDTEIEINSVWDEDLEDLTPTGCTAYYHRKNNKIYFTPDFISI